MSEPVSGKEEKERHKEKRQNVVLFFVSASFLIHVTVIKTDRTSTVHHTTSSITVTSESSREVQVFHVSFSLLLHLSHRPASLSNTTHRRSEGRRRGIKRGKHGSTS